MAKAKSKLQKAKEIASKVKKPNRKKASVERYTKQGQNAPQSKAWTEPTDESVSAKPIGWRFTTEGAKRLRIANPKAKPSKEQIEKYRNKTFVKNGEENRYLYQERRVDKSDKSAKVKFKEGGGIRQSSPQSQSYKRSADKKVPAKPVGWRYKGNNYNKPSDAVIKREKKKDREDRKIYFEKRKDKSDYDFYKKFGKGGFVTELNDAYASDDLRNRLAKKMKKGDTIVAFAYTDYGGDFFDKVAIEYFKKNHPKNIVFENSGYGGQNGIVFGTPAKEFLEEVDDYLLGYEDMEMFYYEMEYRQTQEDFERFLEDLEKYDNYKVEPDALEWLMENRSGYYSMQPNQLDFSSSDLEKTLVDEGLITKEDDYMDGGMMKSGGSVRQSSPQSQSYKRSADKKVPAKPVGWRYKGNNYNKPSDAVIKREMKKDREDRRIYFETRKDKSDFDFYDKLEDGGMMKKGGFFGRQYNPYNKAMDGNKTAKPVGYRFTNELAKRLNKRKYAKPTKAEVEKYLGRGVYWEGRQDKSDLKPTTSKTYASFGYGGDIKEYTKNEAIQLVKDSGKKRMTFYYNVYGGQTYFTLDRTFATPTGKLMGFPSSVSIYADGRITGKNLTYEYGGENEYARGGVERISNAESRTYTENMIPFKANNLEGKTLSNGDYVVLSYGYYPIWWYCKAEGKWYGNSTKYSVSTSKHMSQSRPSYDATMLSRDELEKKMMSHSARFEMGGSLDLLADTSGASLQSVGGTAFSNADLTAHLDMNANPNF